MLWNTTLDCMFSLEDSFVWENFHVGAGSLPSVFNPPSSYLKGDKTIDLLQVIEKETPPVPRPKPPRFKASNL